MYILAGSHVLAMFILQQEVKIQCVHYANYKLTLLPFRRLPLSLGVPEGAAAHVLGLPITTSSKCSLPETCTAVIPASWSCLTYVKTLLGSTGEEHTCTCTCTQISA